MSLLWLVAIVLFIAWMLGAFAFHIGGGLIHLLLVIILIVVIVRLVTGRRVD
jgi:K+-transporting ATPase A subunit